MSRRFSVKERALLDFLMVMAAGLVARFLLMEYVFSFSLGHYDCFEYLSTSLEIFQGKINSVRLPLYPMLIAIATKLFPFLMTKHAVLVLQSSILVFCCGLTYFTAKELFHKRSLALIIAFFISVNPYIVSWEYIMLTESLSFGFTLLIFLFFIKSLKTNRSVYVHLLFLTLILSVFTKLLFLYLFFPFAVILFFWKFRERYPLKLPWLSLAYSALFVVVLLLYADQNKKQNSMPALSESGKIQWYIKIYDYELYELLPEHPASIIMRDAKTKGVNHWDVFASEQQRIGARNLYTFFEEIRSQNPVKIWYAFSLASLKNMYEASLLPMNAYYSGMSWNLHRIDPQTKIPTALVLLVALADLVLVIRRRGLRKMEAEDLWWVAADLFILYTFTLGAVGSFDEYARFIFPAYGIILFLAAKWLIGIYYYLWPDKVLKRMPAGNSDVPLD